MTREKLNSYIRLVPRFMKDAYGIERLPDLGEPSERVEYQEKSYSYYSHIPGVLIGCRLVMWETEKEDLDKMDIHNPEHFAEILRRGSRLQYDNIVGMVDMSRSGRLNVQLILSEHVPSGLTESVSVDNTLVYYNPSDIDLESNAGFKILAKAMFLLKRYDREYIIPYRGRKPEDWGMYD